VHTVSVEITEVKRVLDRTRRRWENNIKMDIKWDMSVGRSMWLRTGTSGGLS
jgi:hypothetical protein